MSLKYEPQPQSHLALQFAYPATPGHAEMRGRRSCIPALFTEFADVPRFIDHVFLRRFVRAHTLTHAHTHTLTHSHTHTLTHSHTHTHTHTHSHSIVGRVLLPSLGPCTACCPACVLLLSAEFFFWCVCVADGVCSWQAYFKDVRSADSSTCKDGHSKPSTLQPSGCLSG